MKLLGGSADFELTEHMTQKNLKMTNENNSTANDETETTRNAVTNENSENETTNRFVCQYLTTGSHTYMHMWTCTIFIYPNDVRRTTQPRTQRVHF